MLSLITLACHHLLSVGALTVQFDIIFLPSHSQRTFLLSPTTLRSLGRIPTLYCQLLPLRLETHICKCSLDTWCSYPQILKPSSASLPFNQLPITLPFLELSKFIYFEDTPPYPLPSSQLVTGTFWFLLVLPSAGLINLPLPTVLHTLDTPSSAHLPGWS